MVNIGLNMHVISHNNSHQGQLHKKIQQKILVHYYTLQPL